MVLTKESLPNGLATFYRTTLYTLKTLDKQTYLSLKNLYAGWMNWE